jgi:Cadherin-like domain/Putative Ig domain
MRCAYKGSLLCNDQEVESITLADSTVITASQIRQALLAEASTSGDDVILGYLQSDNIRAGAGDDNIISGGGSDRIDGGAGWDSVELEGAQSRYVIEQRDGYLAVRDIEQPGRSIWLRNVEKLSFAGDDNTPVSVVNLAINTAPVAGALDLTTGEDTALRLPINAILAAAQDPDGGSLVVSAVSGSVGGTVTFDSTGAVLFVPDANFVGAAGFDYTVSDSSGLTDTARVNIAVTTINDAPLRTLALIDQAFAEDQPVSFTLTAGAFTDADGDALSLSATLSDGSALPAWFVFNSTTGGFSGQPPANFSGSTSIVVTASDG